ncbi:MAG: cell division FtsA domain-containing protein [Alphaproteobacteria bacterium]|nr:cell division FtsA domain-containing protein [Alphaproteobacteria bacterium]
MRDVPLISVGIDIGSYATKIAIVKESPARPTQPHTHQMFSRAQETTHTQTAHAQLLTKGYHRGIAQEEFIKNIHTTLETVRNKIGTIPPHINCAIHSPQVELIQDSMYYATDTPVLYTKEHLTQLEYEYTQKIARTHPAHTLYGFHIHALTVDGLSHDPDTFVNVAMHKELTAHIQATIYPAHIFNTLTQITQKLIENCSYTPTQEYLTLLVTAEDRRIGVVCVDIGDALTTVAAWKNNTCVCMYTYPMGGSHITEKIAVALKVSIEEAEQLKKTAYQNPNTQAVKTLEKTIEKACKQILIPAYHMLSSIKTNSSVTYPAGVKLTGGTTDIPHITLWARSIFSLHASVLATTNSTGQTKTLLNIANQVALNGFNAPDENQATKRSALTTLSEYFLKFF